jgi:hypothetical protein
MAAVLANPSKFEEKQLQLFGYLHKVPGTGLTALFLTRDHAIYGDYTSSILLGDSKLGDISGQCAGQYVLVYGVLHSVLHKMNGLIVPGGQSHIFYENFHIYPVRADGKSYMCWPLVDH